MSSDSSPRDGDANQLPGRSYQPGWAGGTQAPDADAAESADQSPGPSVVAATSAVSPIAASGSNGDADGGSAGVGVANGMNIGSNILNDSRSPIPTIGIQQPTNDDDNPLLLQGNRKQPRVPSGGHSRFAVDYRPGERSGKSMKISGSQAGSSDDAFYGARTHLRVEGKIGGSVVLSELQLVRSKLLYGRIPD
jgi:hypothetical protein